MNSSIRLNNPVLTRKDLTPIQRQTLDILLREGCLPGTGKWWWPLQTFASPCRALMRRGLAVSDGRIDTISYQLTAAGVLTQSAY